MGGREVNSTAPKLYLIFIHMNTAGWDRLPQTNWNAWDRGGLQRGKQKGLWGWKVVAWLGVYEFLRVYKESRIHWYGWKDTNHCSILILLLPAYTQTSIILCHAWKPNSIQLMLPSFWKYITDERLWANSEVLIARWTISLQTDPFSLSLCLHEYPLHTRNQILIQCPVFNLSWNKP